MKRTILLLALLAIAASAQEKSAWYPIIGSAYVDNASYAFLRRLCDEAGGRLVGSPSNEAAIGILKNELERFGYQVRMERFSFAGWERGKDVVRVSQPFSRDLRAVALGNVDQTPFFTGDLAYARQGYPEDFVGLDGKNKIVLVTQEQAPGREELLRYEAIDNAAAAGAKGILFINDRPGGITMAGMADFQGTPSKIPAYSLTYEEGQWLRRLVDAGTPVRIEIATQSRCAQVRTANVVIALPGQIADKIVVGAHFDSWDVGQGAVDNGVGTAILFEMARLLKAYAPKNYYTVELVWFNGEEMGLWGSKKYIEMHKGDRIAAMLNMDMTGTPTGFTAMGTDTLVPFLKQLAESLNGFGLSPDIGNTPWTNSDNQPFMLEGIPTLSLHAHLDEGMGRHYHDLGDTFDKVSKRYLSDAAAVATVLVRELANNRSLGLRRRTDAETIDLLKKHKLDARLKKQKEWPFGNEE